MPNPASSALRRIKQIILLELPRRNTLLKHNIQFLKRPPPTLRNPKIAPHQAANTDPPKQKPRLSPPIRLVTIQHIRHRHCKHNRSKRLHSRRDSDRLPAQPRGRDLGDDHEADGPNSHLVDEGPDIH